MCSLLMCYFRDENNTSTGYFPAHVTVAVIYTRCIYAATDSRSVHSLYWVHCVFASSVRLSVCPDVCLMPTPACLHDEP